jgi:beta-lactamase class A
MIRKPLLISRRSVVVRGLLAAPALALWRPLQASQARDPRAGLADLEAKQGGRLGVAALDTATGTRIEHRAGERFPMCSTFKFLAAALALARVDRGEESLDRRVVFAQKDLVPYSPATKERVGAPGMTVAELCEAAMIVSDNTAANLLLASFGGPAGLTSYARSLGDEVTRLDRIEPDLNEGAAGDPRDTTTPAAMVGNLQRLVLGDALSQASRERLTAWLVANKTGDARLRAGVPKSWRVGDKTGTGDRGATNDIAVVWPPKRAPIVIAVYYLESPASLDQRNAVIADVARIVAASV